MKTSFSSAGLLYVYITGYKEMELLHIEQIDTYSYIGDELYNKIMEISEVMTQNENSIHVFGVIGIEKKVNYVYTILEEGIKKNFDRILNNRKIKIGTKIISTVVFRNFIVINYIIYRKKWFLILMMLVFMEYMVVL